jgi:hypothetical protein
MCNCGCQEMDKDLQVTIPRDQYTDLLRKARAFDLLVEGAGQLVRGVSETKGINKL